MRLSRGDEPSNSGRWLTNQAKGDRCTCKLFDFVLLLFGDTGHQTPNLIAKLPGLAVAMVFHGEHAETDLGDVKVVPTALSIAR